MSSSNVMVLSDLTADYSQFTSQFNTFLASTPTWQGTLTTMTSQTLIGLISSVGTYDQGTLIRAYEDAFSETAQSDSAIYAIATMQGLRMSRKLPANLTATINSTIDITLSPFTQFLIGGQYYFNKQQITIIAGTPYNTPLFQGQLISYSMNGLGGPNQTFLSDDDAFSVSDQDVLVTVNGIILPKSLGGLWNYKNLPAYGDLTTNDGRLLIIFGSNQFGTTPGLTDSVVVTYAVTQGTGGNSQLLSGANVTVVGVPSVTGLATSNPQDGSDEQPVATYKNLAAGAFGTYQSAVTKAQYEATVGVYPGIIDAFTQAQRDINPSALEWMNVIRISAVTTTVWTQAQIQAFINYLQTVTMYSTRFLWQAPVAVPNNVTVNVFCFNSANLSAVKQACITAIKNLFLPRPGILMTNFYPSDITDVCKAAGNGLVSYVIVEQPTGPMIVTAPPSPVATYTLNPGGGTLGSLVYAYGITALIGTEEGPPSNWVFPQVITTIANYAITLTWNPPPDATGITAYKVYGRQAGSIGLLATIAATSPLTFTDTGSITPSGLPPNSIAQVPISYNTLGTLVVNTDYSERQQQIGTTVTSPTRGA